MGALVKLSQATKAVTTAGTAVPIVATDIYTQSILIQADAGNTGAIAVGDSDVDAGIGTQNAPLILPGNALELSGDMMGRGGDFEFNLKDIYIDSLNNGDKIYITYVERNSN